MKLYLISAFLFVSATGYTKAQLKDSLSGKLSAPAAKEDFSDDWAALTKYQQENKKLPAPTQAENRVVFLGSSIFERWKQVSLDFFKGKPYIDRGISGQISPQLLIRFRQDVINLKPKVVAILAGSNDIAGNTGHLKTYRNNVIMFHQLY